MKSSDIKKDNVPTSAHRSLRNRPSQLLYQPPAKRCTDKSPKVTSTSPRTFSAKSETCSKNTTCSMKPTEYKRESLHGSQQAEEKESLTDSKITSTSPSSQEDLHGASYTRLKPLDVQCLSERKPGLGRGSLLKLQLLYENKYLKADKTCDRLEIKSIRGEMSTTCVSNSDQTSPQLSENFNMNNNNHLDKSFLESPGSDSAKFHEASTFKQIDDDFKPFMCENKTNFQKPKCLENILPSSTEAQGQGECTSEDVAWKIGGDQASNVVESLESSGDWEPEDVALDSSGLGTSLQSPQKRARDENDKSSVPDESFTVTALNGDSKETTEIFSSYSQSEDNEAADVFDSQSSLSDETYLSVYSCLSEVEENSESINKSDQDSLFSESNNWAGCVLEGSSGDNVGTSAKTSFSDSPNENNHGSKSSLSFQEETEEVTNFVDARDGIAPQANYQAGDNQLNWSLNPGENQTYRRQSSTRHTKQKFFPKSDTCQRSDLPAISTSPWSPYSGRERFFSFCPSTANYKITNSPSPPTHMTRQTIFENSPSGRASQPGTNRGDCIINALRSHVKEISLRNRDHWKQLAFQYQTIFGNVESSPKSWKENYKKKCSEAGHKFLDTHCHIDMMLNEHLDRIFGNFQEYREANADSFPNEFGGCVAIFCNPLTFNPRGSLFRSLVNEDSVWIAVGCHPKKVKFLNKRTLQQLNECIRMPQVVAVGEIGLDYSGMFHLEAEIQKDVFRTQIKLALDVSKPIVIHCRDAEEDCFSILKAECPLDWLIHLHCYMLDFEHAQKWLDTFPNLYIGLTPKVTYKNAFNVHDTARKIPLTRLVLESDAPYFIPSIVPFNQLKCSHPGLVFTVAEAVANLQGRNVKDVLKACWDNSHRLYRIKTDI